MREILFRAKGQTGGKWHVGLLTMADEDACHIKDDRHNEWICDSKTVCQYTGLTDRNGRKIFEGDIVRYTDEVTGKEKADEVEYNETHAAFCRLHKGEMGVQYLFIDESIADRCEVTGNIYDNPAPADAT